MIAAVHSAFPAGIAVRPVPHAARTLPASRCRVALASARTTARPPFPWILRADMTASASASAPASTTAFSGAHQGSGGTRAQPGSRVPPTRGRSSITPAKCNRSATKSLARPTWIAQFVLHRHALHHRLTNAHTSPMSTVGRTRVPRLAALARSPARANPPVGFARATLMVLRQPRSEIHVKMTGTAPRTCGAKVSGRSPTVQSSRVTDTAVSQNARSPRPCRIAPARLAPSVIAELQAAAAISSAIRPNQIHAVASNWTTTAITSAITGPASRSTGTP